MFTYIPFLCVTLGAVILLAGSAAAGAARI